MSKIQPPEAGNRFTCHFFLFLKRSKDIFIACCDGLTGFPDAIEAVFPKTQVQLCIVHRVRNSLSYVSYKDRKAVAADLRLVYTASTEAQAEQHWVELAEKWDKQYPTYAKGGAKLYSKS